VLEVITRERTEFYDRHRVQRKLRDMSTFWRDRIDTWRAEGTESGTEKRHAQQFWSDLMGCFDIASERVNVFERNASRASTGGRGYIDFFWSGLVIGEAKSLDIPLERGYNQVLDYLNGGSVGSHEWPLYTIVTNFEQIRLDRLGDEPWTVEFTIDELVDHLDQLLFFVGIETLTKQEQENASIEAAKLMANLFNTLAGEDADTPVGEEAPATPEEEDETIELASVLMTRLLFLMYGDDAGLWEQDLFYRWLDTVNSKNLGPALDGLFEILNTDEQARIRKYRGNLSDLEARFPYVNGGIFDGTAQVGYSVPPEFKDALLDACRFRWTQISPAVFGSMFQLVKSKEARRGDGEHYTSETNILKTIGPLFLDEYRDRADRLIARKSTSVAELKRFQEELAANIYVDPACGAGNFLNVAYAKLREIETDIIVERLKKGTGTGALVTSFEQLLTIDKFYGFEINWWPAKIAETAMFLVDHQANRYLAEQIGQAPDRLPIKITATIVHDNALDINWAEYLPKPSGQTYIFGNPPFIGQSKKEAEQTEDMERVWGEDYAGYLDYVTGWHAKSKDLLARRAGEFAFVATNSIAHGMPVRALFEPLYREGWDIKFAHRTFGWDSEAPGQASVHCVIIGFTKDRTVRQKLWAYSHPKGQPELQRVERGINAYLIDGPRLLVKDSRKPLSPMLPPVHYGTKPADGGHLVFKAKEGKRGYDRDPIAAKYLRRFVGAKELVEDIERWCFWFEDLTPEDRRNSHVIQEVIEACQQWRAAQKPTGDAYKLKDTPHLMRPNKSRTNDPYLCIPIHVGKDRKYWTAARFGPEVINGNANFMAPDEDGLLFGLISSSMFMTWQQSVGGRIKSDLRFSNTLTWNTFPVPNFDAGTRRAIINAGQKILEARELTPERSLEDLYDPYLMASNRPLQKAHDDLDRIVDRIFGAHRRLTTEKQRQELLFPAYEQLVRS